MQDAQGRGAVRPKISWATLTYLSPQGHKGLTVSSFALSRYDPHPAERLPTWTSYTTLSPQPNGFTSLTACRIIQTSPSYPPSGARDHLILLLLQTLPSTASALHSLTSATPMWPYKVFSVFVPLPTP